MRRSLIIASITTVFLGIPLILFLNRAEKGESVFASEKLSEDGRWYLMLKDTTGYWLITDRDLIDRYKGGIRIHARPRKDESFFDSLIDVFEDRYKTRYGAALYRDGEAISYSWVTDPSATSYGPARRQAFRVISCSVMGNREALHKALTKQNLALFYPQENIPPQVKSDIVIVTLPSVPLAFV